MTQFLRDEGSDSEEVITPLMLDGTYLSRNFATLGPFLTLQPPCGMIIVEVRLLCLFNLITKDKGTHAFVELN